ncbi:cell division protein SepF [Secundilactobacillus collinoides]|uniref:Cell division protein SepF n=1 Tax=Secundilactobacillus collinoides TaxID=33960 RepID=A0A166HJ12_SECCO|nr:cell division protein SepF [Secundilactobacillus collinoides]KZL42761.1 cell division protein SepF [Secundilactobacillus collinoides]
MGKFSMSRFFGIDDDYDMADYNQTDEQAPTENDAIRSELPRRSGNKVVSINAPRPSANKIALFEPRLYSDVQEIASQLIKNQAVIVNLGRIDKGEARRIIDFLTGTVFAIEGDIERVGDQIFLCTPRNFEISGDISASLNDKLN